MWEGGKSNGGGGRGGIVRVGRVWEGGRVGVVRVGSVGGGQE